MPDSTITSTTSACASQRRNKAFFSSDNDFLHRLISARLFLAAAPLVLAVAVLLVMQFWSLRASFLDGLQRQANQAASQLQDAAANHDPIRGLLALQDLEHHLPEFVGATVIDAQGKVLLEYWPNGRQTSYQQAAILPPNWSLNTLQAAVPDGRANLVLKVDAGQVYGQFARLGLSALLIMTAAYAFTWQVTRNLRSRLAGKARELRHMAHYDSVTGLPNRNLFQYRLHDALQRAHLHMGEVAVLFIDLDNFKIVNDTLGHDAGDALLHVIGQRLAGMAGERSIVCRLGGDEFVLLLEDTTQEAAQSAASLAIRLLGQPVELMGQQIYIGASIGIARYPQDGDDAATLLRCADTAMYQAKENGKNVFQFYTPDLNLRTMQHFAIETSLRQALERNELTLYYQPQVDLETRSIIGVEALLRWKSAEFGTFASGDFIAIAEQSGLINQLGAWAIETACRQARTWQDEGLDNLVMSVNLSARQLHTGDIVALVRETLQRTGLEPHRLELEITESVLLKDHQDIMAKLLALTELGVKLAIDDFGTGYSSLAYLQRLPIQRLKIDRSFVRESHTTPDDAAIAQAIIGMAHGLGIEVTAEGVENSAQADFLKQAGCRVVQGYYFGSPLPAEDLEKLVRQVRAPMSASFTDRPFPEPALT